MSDSNELRSVFASKRVLVTGDSGFKGSWLALWLLSLGAHVYGFSLAPRSLRDVFVMARLSEKYNHTEGDIRNFGAVKKLLEEVKPDIIFHLAAQPLVLDSYSDPLGTIQTNCLGTTHVLEAARYSDSVCAIVNVTTDKCYENREWVYGYRECDPLGGKDPYSASKAMSEIITASYAHSFYKDNHRILAATARAGNVIGGGDWAPYRIVPDCIRALELGQPVVIRNPQAIRPWQHVFEPLRGYLMLGARLLQKDRTFCGPWNFGPLPGNVLTVGELAAHIIKVWGCGAIETVADAKAVHEAGFLHLDISKTMYGLGWKPVLDQDTTVSWTVNQYRQLYDVPHKDRYDYCIQQIDSYCTLCSKKVSTV